MNPYGPESMIMGVKRARKEVKKKYDSTSKMVVDGSWPGDADSGGCYAGRCGDRLLES